MTNVLLEGGFGGSAKGVKGGPFVLDPLTPWQPKQADEVGQNLPPEGRKISPQPQAVRQVQPLS